MNRDKIRVGIRGFGGLLGTRLVAALRRMPDMEITAGVMRKDSSLDRLLKYAGYSGLPSASVFASHMFLDEPAEVVADVNARNWMAQFAPLSELDLNQLCDVVIDAASPGRNHSLQDHYQKFKGHVIYQDGEYPRGWLIAPPLTAQSLGGNRYRQGGCFLSGVVPVLAALGQYLKSARINLVMQYDGRESDYMVAERVNCFRVADHYRPRMEEELRQLFPNIEIAVESVIQIPSLVHYVVSLVLETEQLPPITVQNMLDNIPHCRLMPILDTHELNLARVTTDSIPPISILFDTLQTKPGDKGMQVELKLALYYRNLAVLPNIDAVRILATGADPIDAMRQTDRELGFSGRS
ncbi:MAG: hypothetical protein HY395_01735 [Candidatus Doudnabacteria bacterium]|nr:hypothetical protein [Candidatus Doudnabacteria bacterium]